MLTGRRLAAEGDPPVAVVVVQVVREGLAADGELAVLAAAMFGLRKSEADVDQPLASLRRDGGTGHGQVFAGAARERERLRSIQTPMATTPMR